MVKGGTSDVLSTLSSLAMISMSPVGRWSFLLVRSDTVPEICTTYSRPSLLAASQSAASVSMSKTACVMP